MSRARKNPTNESDQYDYLGLKRTAYAVNNTKEVVTLRSFIVRYYEMMGKELLTILDPIFEEFKFYREKEIQIDCSDPDEIEIIYTRLTSIDATIVVIFDIYDEELTMTYTDTRFCKLDMNSLTDWELDFEEPKVSIHELLENAERSIVEELAIVEAEEGAPRVCDNCKQVRGRDDTPYQCGGYTFCDVVCFKEALQKGTIPELRGYRRHSRLPK